MPTPRTAPSSPLNMEDFLILYYRQLHFDRMPVHQRATFDGYRKSDDFNGNMKSWKTDLINASGENYELPDMTNPAFISNGDAEKIFKSFQSTLQSMDANKKRLAENKDANNFLSEYFGLGKLFAPEQASAAAESSIDKLKNVLSAHRIYFEKLLNDNRVLDADTDLAGFIRDIDSKKYNSDAKFANKIKRVSDILQDRTMYASHYNVPTNIETDLNSISGDYDVIKNGFDSTVNPHKLQFFKNNHKSLLNDIYSSEKLRSAFETYGDSKITGPYARAIEKTDYTNENSKDFLVKKPDDKLTLGQKISNWKADTYENYFDKYKKLTGDRMFFSNSSKMIVKAIDGAKIKPTDGLDKILSESGKISDNLKYKSPTAANHFDYFVKSMKEIKTTTPKAFAGAMKNGSQMRAIVSKLIINSIKSGKIDEAKTAMEILAVTRYGLTTSRVMDIMKNEPFTLFSDGGLSWNKDAGTQFVTNALDKSIKFAMLGVGYTMTAATNLIRRSGTKFNEKKKNLGDAYDKEQSNKRQKIQNATAKLNELNGDLGTTRGNETSLTRDIGALTGRLAGYSPALTTDAIKRLGKLSDADRIAELTILPFNFPPMLAMSVSRDIEQFETKSTELGNATNYITFLNDQITAQNTEISELNADQSDKYRDLMAYWDYVTKDNKMTKWAPRSRANQQKKFMDPHGVAAAKLANYTANYRVA